MMKTFAFLLLPAASSAQNQFPSLGSDLEFCDHCVGNDQVDMAASLGPIPCSDWYSMTNFTFEGTEACVLSRTAGAKFCDCGNTVDFNTCYLCGDPTSNANANIDLEKYIPDSPGGALTCGDLLEMPAVDDVETCNLLTAKYARWCGCPNVDQNPPCPFCPEGAPPNLELPYPFGEAAGLSCSELHDFYLVQTAESCEANRAADFQYYVVDILAYCQCPGRSPPNLCQGPFCPSGQGIPTSNLNELIGTGNLGITCGDSDFLMEYISKQEDCDFLLSQSDVCCGDASEVSNQVDSGNANSGNVFEGEGQQVSGVAAKTTTVVSFLALSVLPVLEKVLL